MFTLTKNESEILRILNRQEGLKNEPLKKQNLIEEICKNEKSFDAARQVENAIDGCVAKEFVALTNDGFFKITEEGKKQI